MTTQNASTRPEPQDPNRDAETGRANCPCGPQCPCGPTCECGA
jgi:hypothetical protein